MMFRRIMAVMRLEALHLLRDKTSLALLISVPLMEVMLFGLTVNIEPRDLKVVLEGGTEVQIEQTETILADTGYFRPPAKTQDAEAAVRSGDALIGIRLPGRVDAFDETATQEPVEVFVDTTQSATVTPALGALARSGLAYSSDRLDAAAPPPTIHWLFNPERRTNWTILPGLIGLVLMISMLILGALMLAREREAGTLENLMTTPLTPTQLMLGKCIPYLGAAMVQGLVVTFIAIGIFDVPFQGPALALGLGVLLFALAHLNLGYWISSQAATQLQAIQAAIGFYLPAILLSGFLFPYQGMPQWARVLGEIFPLTHMVRLARGLMLKGDGWAVAVTHIWPIAVFALVFTIVIWLTTRRGHS